MTEGAALPASLIVALPAGSAMVSGGNLYNARLIAALASRTPVRAESIEIARACVERGLAGIYLFDSLDLDRLAIFPAPAQGQYFGLLVHHLPSLEPDLENREVAVRAEEALLRRFDVLVVTSPFTAEYLRARGHSPARIVTVVPAPPAPRLDPRTYEPPLSALLVANLIPRKAVLELLRLLDQRVAPADHFTIDVVGRDDIDADYARSCVEYVRRSPRLGAIVTFRGAIAPDGMKDLYARAGALVSASKMETFGMALQEARSYRIPILALDGGHAAQHFTDGENGLLCLSLSALADALVGIARDPARARRLFERSQQMRTQSSYDWDQAAEHFLEQLSACLDGLQRARS
jgi:glycosyltransferase involved in cell wall biosynthesis